jgi:hypothetical protein
MRTRRKENSNQPGGWDRTCDRDIRFVIQKAAAEREKPHRCQLLGVLPAQRLVGRQLRQNELVERQIAIERADNPVAINVAIGVATLFLEDISFRVRVAGDVEPVSRPPFAETRVGKQSIDKVWKSVRRSVADEFVHLLCFRRHAGKVKMSATNERPPIGRRRHCQSLFRQPRDNEGVHWRLYS